jgi:dihydrofolate reductase
MEGGTTFHFVTEGMAVALERARHAAGGRDVRLGGGANVIRQCLRQRLMDEMHVVIAPVMLGAVSRSSKVSTFPHHRPSCRDRNSRSSAAEVSRGQVRQG